MTFLLCDPDWYVHKRLASRKNGMTTHTHTYESKHCTCRVFVSLHVDFVIFDDGVNGSLFHVNTFVCLREYDKERNKLYIEIKYN